MSHTSIFAAALFALAAIGGCVRHRSPEHPEGAPLAGHGAMAEGHAGGMDCPMMHMADGGAMAAMQPGPDGGVACPMHEHAHEHAH